MLYFSVSGQKLERTDKKVIAASSIDYLQARFTFSDEWDGLQKAASFEQGETKHTIILTDDEILKSDHLNLGEGTWYVGVVGVEADGGTTVERITTDTEHITVEPTILADGSSPPESPLTFAEQLLAAATQSLYELAVANGFEGTLEEWLQTLVGNGIASITKTGTVGLVDTYTITFDDENTTNFSITNGKNGSQTYSGSAISGNSETPTIYDTGITYANENDRYRNTDSESESYQNEYKCVTPGNAATAEWVYDGNVKGNDGQGSPSDSNPLMNGTANAGTGSAYSRNDHVHPSDTSRAKKSIIADGYTATTWTVGEFCVQDNDFYECTTEITEAEEWNAAHWTQRTIGYVLNALNNSIAIKTALAILAPEYDPEAAGYALGVFVSRAADGKFYECTTAITSPEAWTAGHWTERTIGYVLKALAAALDTKQNKATVSKNTDAAPALGTIAHNCEYRCTNTTPSAVPTFTIPAISADTSEFGFVIVYKAKSASPSAPNPTNNSGYTLTGHYVGKDCAGGTFTPVASTWYILSYRFNGIYLTCYVEGL